MAGAHPEERVERAVVHQGWRQMAFVHWQYDPSELRRLVPKELDLDLWDDAAWVSLTPFQLVGFRLPGIPPIPGLSSFPETNLRTYVKGPDGRDGLYFLSLDVDSVATAIGARLGFGVPYHWADMKIEEEGAAITYRSTRRRSESREPPMHHIVVRPGHALTEAELTERDHWLTGRWRAWTKVAGRVASVPVRHEPWPLWSAEVEELHETLLAAADLASPAQPPLVHFSPGVDVHLGPPRPVRVNG